MSTKRQLSRFLVVGTTTVALDMVVYTGLLALAVPVSISKAIGFVAGTIFAYNANRVWTFSVFGGQRAIFRFLIVYFSGLALNVGANSLFVAILGQGEITILIAFIAATGFSAIYNFLGMKFFVFTKNIPVEKVE